MSVLGSIRTVYEPDAFLDGDLDEMMDTLITAEQAEKLRGSDNQF